MSGFFSLGGSKDQQDQDQHQQQHTDTNSSLFLFKNEEIYNKGFELWQQYYQLHQQRAHQSHHHHHQSNIQDVDFSVGPSRRNNETSSSNLIINPSSSGHNIGDDSLNYNSYRLSSSSSGFGMMTRQGRSSGSEGINCQDCGNQAKKDCMHMRCRTCCKSRGFECQTHVKSTWVPAAKRRERQQQLSALSQQQQQVNVRGESSGKRLSDDSSGVGGGGNSTCIIACTTANSSRLAANSSGFELGHFPAEVNSPAVFRCVRVSAVDDPEEHLAYQTAVNIAGHVFKGILYDQGPENRYSTSMTIGGGGGSSHQRPLNLIAGAATTAAATTSAAITGSSNVNITSLVNDPSSMTYPTPLSSFMAGTQFFPPPRP